jgi:Rod binding domain-containing protein
MAGATTSSPAAFAAATAAASMRPAPKMAATADPEAVKKTAKDFEAFFISQMLESMFKEVPIDKFFGGGQAENVWRSMMLQQYGRAIADHGGIGIADMVSREMLKMQEVR